MEASTAAVARRHFFRLASSWAMILPAALGGCGPSSGTPMDLTPEAKKALAQAKGADLSQYRKPKGTSRNRR
jgi:hypothetical protein